MSTMLISNVKRVEEREKNPVFFFVATIDKRLLTVLFYED